MKVEKNIKEIAQKRATNASPDGSISSREHGVKSSLSSKRNATWRAIQAEESTAVQQDRHNFKLCGYAFLQYVLASLSFVFLVFEFWITGIAFLILYIFIFTKTCDMVDVFAKREMKEWKE